MKTILLRIIKWFNSAIPNVKYNIWEKITFGVGILLGCFAVLFGLALNSDTHYSDMHSELALFGIACCLLGLIMVLTAELSAVYRTLAKTTDKPVVDDLAKLKDEGKDV